MSNINMLGGGAARAGSVLAHVAPALADNTPVIPLITMLLVRNVLPATTRSLIVLFR